MNKLALVGLNGVVMANVLTALLKHNRNATVFSPYPERVMLNNTNINWLNTSSRDDLLFCLAGFKTIVIALENNLTNAELNDYILRNYPRIIDAAIAGGAHRIIVVGGKESEAFYRSKLSHVTGPKCSFINTEGDYASAVINVA